MSTHLNLLLLENRASSRSRALKIAFQKTTILTSLLIALLSIREPNHQKSPLKEWSEARIFQALRLKCDLLEFPSTIAHLKDNFLTNKRVDDDHLRSIYRSSGLSHLLALSGGQTAPAAYIICLFLTFCTVMTTRLFISVLQSKYLKIFFAVSSALEILTLGFLVCLFQATGALSRALSSQSVELFRFLDRITVVQKSCQERWLSQIAQELAPWIIVWLIHKNPVHDLSFLLSLLGAKTVGLVSICCAPLNKCDTVRGSKSQILQYLEHTIRSIIYWVTVTAVTSALMCVFCAALWPIDNVIQKVQANLVAGPIVLFLVTPASLLILAWIGLSQDQPPTPMRAFLELGLYLFHEAALAFSSHDEPKPQQARTFLSLPFSGDWFEHPYLPLLATIVALSGAHWLHRALGAKTTNSCH